MKEIKDSGFRLLEFFGKLTLPCQVLIFGVLCGVVPSESVRAQFKRAKSECGELPMWMVMPQILGPFAYLVALWVLSLSLATVFILVASFFAVVFIVGGMAALFGR